jgi:hypothetical protein
MTELKTQYFIGVDPAFGSSKFGIVIVCIIDDKLCVLESIELDRQDFKYNLSSQNIKISVDASAPAVIT